MLYLFLCLTLLLSSNTKGEDFQVSVNGYENLHVTGSSHEHFLRPIKFTHHGMRCFICHAYNHPDYGIVFLPNNFYHMIQLINRTTLQTRSYYQSVFRMFGNKLKQSMYVNAYAFSDLLQETTSKLQELCTNVSNIPAIDLLQKKISATMYDAMLNKFDYLKLDPTGYFEDLSQDILVDFNAAQELADDISIEELRKSLVVFLELCLNKCVWSPHDCSDTWNSIKTIAEQLHQLHEKQILKDREDLNDLFVSLIERFCFYLDLSFSEIPTDFYASLHKEIDAKNLFFLEFEGEQFFETKARRLSRAVVSAEAKTRAYHQGILLG